MQRESIFFSSIRAFFITVFVFLGIGIGLIALLIVVGALGSIDNGEVERSYKETILPDADGVRKSLASTTPVILQLEIKGVIGTELLSAAKIRQQLVESREGSLKDDRVKGVLVHVNTPGGTVVDSDSIYHALKDYKERYKVPVYVYVDGLCASGGMYVACAADKIYASDSSIIGSVGVLIPTFMNFSQTLDKIGVQTLSVTAGKDKDAMNPLRPWKPGEENNFRDIVDYYYGYFVDLVVANRPSVEKQKLVNDYGAKVFPAPQAKEIGFIDEANKSRSDVLRELVKVVGLEGKPYQVIRLESTSWLAELLRGETPLLTGKVKHQIQLGSDLDPELLGKFLYLYRPEHTSL